jgi:FtsP/CotA-like multicopper oxidase with cupredoxin domain
VNPATGTVAANVTVDKRRVLTLNEVMGPGGPLEILMNNTTYTGEESAAQRALAGFNDFTPITTQWKSTQYSELPVEGTTELWEIVNLTADAHPIHPHLVAFQILNRQTLSAGYKTAYDNAFPAKVYTPGFGPPCNYNNISVGACAPPKRTPAGYMLPLGGNPDPTFYVVNGVFPPLPAEQGWKDTAISYPGEVLRMLVRFAPTTVPAGTPAANAFYEFDPSFGHGYVWHCHIIDHEDNEMMRPFSVIANPGAPLTRAYQKGIDY